jgi:hypothetical protein
MGVVGGVIAWSLALSSYETGLIVFAFTILALVSSLAKRRGLLGGPTGYLALGFIGGFDSLFVLQILIQMLH